jgi:endonuclease G
LKKSSKKRLAVKEVDKGAKNVTTREIIGHDDSTPVKWFRGGALVSESVAFLTVTRYTDGKIQTKIGSSEPIKYSGTGWLIGKQYVITNHHVINARDDQECPASEADLITQAKNTMISFDYENKDEEQTCKKVKVDSLSEWSSYGKNGLDFAILKLEKPSERQPLVLAPQWLYENVEGLPVNIIHHPDWGPKKASARNNSVYEIDKLYISYYTDTSTGSSGAPVFNDDWKVIALHRNAKKLPTSANFQGKMTDWTNAGIRIDKIVDYLKTNNKALWTEIGAKSE